MSSAINAPLSAFVKQSLGSLALSQFNNNGIVPFRCPKPPYKGACCDPPDENSVNIYNIADSGTTLNMAILPLVRRGGKKIMAVVNSTTSLPLKKIVNPKDIFDPNIVTVDGELSQLFGIYKPSIENLAHPVNTNVNIFPTNRYLELVNGLIEQKIKGNAAAVLLKDIEVLPSIHYGVKGGYKIDILIYYIDRVTKWEKLLPKETQDLIDPKNNIKKTSDFYNFPNIPTSNPKYGASFFYTNCKYVSSSNILEY